mmetsp:Transcript_4152/g.10488  ORF Transcript_4152/g.10488 Transcript_4152/m.10488 type:complete len:232 (-) Transcript_4152:360-1055(-)
MCHMLGLKPKLLQEEKSQRFRAEAAGQARTAKQRHGSAATDHEHSSTEGHKYCDASTSASEAGEAQLNLKPVCTCMGRGSPKHSRADGKAHTSETAINLSKVLSSGGGGVELHVRSEEWLVIENVAGAGQLALDVYAADDLQPTMDASVQDVIVFDSRAYFHLSPLEPVQLDVRYPGPGLFCFRVIQHEGAPVAPASLSIAFSIRRQRSCSCTRGNDNGRVQAPRGLKRKS